MASLAPPREDVRAVEELERLATVLAGVDPNTLRDEDLADSVIALRRVMDRFDAVFARWADAGHRRAVGQADGVASTAAWLRHRGRMREGDARAAIDDGDAAALLRATGRAWLAGEISTAEARTIFGTRVRDHDEQLMACEAELLGLAREHRTRDLRRACAHFRNLARADGEQPGARDGLHISPAFDGRTVINGELTDLAAETVMTAIHAYTDPPDPEDHRTVAHRRAAALVRVCEVALGHADEPDVRRGRKSVALVVDWQTLVSGSLGRVDGEFTGPVHRRDVERLLCDSPISRVVTGPDSVPLELGRARRTVPTPLRRALVVRDQGCRWPGCNRPAAWCDGHHVIHWIDGGRTDLDNLVLLCDRHHATSHLQGWRVSFDGVRLVVVRPNGAEMLEGDETRGPPPP
jgi:Domain of unknown function (DUF222)/HNH endonuclease